MTDATAVSTGDLNIHFENMSNITGDLTNLAEVAAQIALLNAKGAGADPNGDQYRNTTEQPTSQLMDMLNLCNSLVHGTTLKGVKGAQTIVDANGEATDAAKRGSLAPEIR
jgi:hypothetical protein